MVGKIVECSRSIEGKPRVTFEVDSFDEIRGMEEKELSIEITTKRNKRSLNANAYFHVLMGKIAEKLKISKQRAKNLLLAKYGQREILEDGPLIISIVSNVDMLEREDIHCVPVGYGEVNGKDFTHWAVLKPSHEYDTKEMAELIDGTIEDAKELGIETLSPAELERMKAAWHINQ
jgi:hypothetical protein